MMMKTFYVSAVLLFVVTIQSFAQGNPMSSIYYQNGFLNNPAMAGINNTVNLNAAVRGQLANNVRGVPVSQAITADVGFSTALGAGLLLSNESIGLFKRTKALVSYAYHIQLSEYEDRLSFGLSAGVMNEAVDMSRASGDLSDQSLNSFNSRPVYLDGDFGVAYSSNSLLLQAAVPNLKRFLKRDVYRNTVDAPIFYASAGYKITLNNLYTENILTPTIAYRKNQAFQDVLDCSAELSLMDEKMIFTGLYRTTKSYTIGAGTTYANKVQILGFYTSNASTIGSTINGEFELALRWKIRTAD